MSIGRKFMLETRPGALTDSQEDQGLPQPPLELPYPEDVQLIELPPHDQLHIPPADLQAIIEKRKTLRRYTDQPLTVEELSCLLWLTQGVKAVTSRPVTLRTVPSAGARHAFETYLLVNSVDGIRRGLYRYVPSRHALLAVDLADGATDRVTEGCFGQEQVRRSAATFVWVAVTPRMYWRYGERGYRYLHLDAGHVCQNLYLASEAIGCGVCAIAAFDDDRLNQVLGVDGEELFAIYAATVGKRVAG